MKRNVIEREQARPRHVRLQCPECTHSVRVARDELVEGGEAYCRHCGNESELTLGFDAGTGREQWMLVDPLTDFEEIEEEGRR